MTLDWDRDILPSLMLWISDRGAEDPPFNGRYRGLGVEPLAAAFDLADAISTAPNPLNRRGLRTAVEITPQAPVCINYSVTAAPL